MATDPIIGSQEVDPFRRLWRDELYALDAERWAISTHTLGRACFRATAEVCIHTSRMARKGTLGGSAGATTVAENYADFTMQNATVGEGLLDLHGDVKPAGAVPRRDFAAS